MYPCATLTVGFLAFALTQALAPSADAQFVEPEAAALSAFTGAGGMGWAVSELRDIDGDGIMDALVGAPNIDGGRLHVYSGATGAELHIFKGMDFGVSSLGYSMADAGFVDADNVPDIVVGATSGDVLIFSGSDFSLIHHIEQIQLGERLGFSVSGVGDVNGDGRDDVIAGADRFDVDGANSIGRAYIISGFDGSLIDTVQGEEAGDLFGSGISGVGDITGDAISEFAVGARNAGPSNRGAIYVYDGATRELLFARVDADSTGSSLGWFFVGPAGDADADGVPDIYAGDFSGIGRCYVISGQTGAILFTRPGTSGGQGFGCGRFAGDVNGDGHDDLAVGSYSSSDGAGGAGKVEIISGDGGGLIRTITSTISGNQFGFDAVGMGDVDNDGMIDFLVGAGGRNRAYIIRGELACLADVNMDAAAEPDDFMAWIQAFNTGNHRADQNHDGVISPTDFTSWIANFNAGC